MFLTTYISYESKKISVNNNNSTICNVIKTRLRYNIIRKSLMLKTDSIRQ